ncbi:MAG: HD domain-containing protein [Actinobacteria bacterium]|nr:HD domain-containing protein [Actinomycetota bacterium]
MFDDNVSKIRRALEDEPQFLTAVELLGSEFGEAYIVGGFIRDALLGVKSNDLDIAVKGDVEKAARLFAMKVGARPFYLDFDRQNLRVAWTGNSVLKTVDFSRLRGDIEDDLALRDFTINSIACPLDVDMLPGKIIDPYGGVEDLIASVIKNTSSDVFVDDALRIVRAYRIAHQLGFHISVKTLHQISADRNLLRNVSGERIWSEFRMMLSLPDFHLIMRELKESEVLFIIFPELKELKGLEQGDYHTKDVLEHTLLSIEEVNQLITEVERSKKYGQFNEYISEHMNKVVAEGLTRYSCLKLALLLHDIGKSDTRDISSGGKKNFVNHADIGARRIIPICERLAIGKRVARYLQKLVRNHLYINLLGPQKGLTNKAIYRLVDRFGDEMIDLVICSEADRTSDPGPVRNEKVQKQIGEFADLLLRLHSRLKEIRKLKLVSGDFLKARYPDMQGKDIAVLKMRIERRLLFEGKLTPDSAKATLIKELGIRNTGIDRHHR